LKKIAVLITILITALVIGCAPTAAPAYPSIATPISVYEGETIVEIPVEEAGEPGIICTPTSFRATQLAIAELWGEEIPQRSDFQIVTACPTPGCEKCLDYITRAKTGEGREGDFRVVLPEGTNLKNLTGQNYAFTFIQKSTGKEINIWVKEGVFPEGFFEKRTKAKFDPAATPAEKKAFKALVKQVSTKISGLPMDELFEFEKR